MALVYTTGMDFAGEEHQVARRDDGQWFGRWVIKGDAKPWMKRADPAPHYGITSDATGPNEIITQTPRNIMHLKRGVQPDLPTDTL